MSRKVTFLGGYRVLDIDYGEGSGSNRLELDLNFHGPLLGVVIKF